MRSHGQPEHELDLKSRHGCTDVPCCILFLVALAAFVPFYFWCLSSGNIGRLYHGINYQGQICGIDPGVINEPYLYWCTSSSVQGKLSLDLADPICVAKCPGADLTGNTAAPFFALEPGCQAVTGTEGLAAYRTLGLLHRYCIPYSGLQDVKDLAKRMTGSELHSSTASIIRSMSSISSAWPALVGAFFISLLVGYVYLFFLRQCAETLIWVSMALCIIAFGWLGIYVWTHAEHFNSLAQQGTGLDDNVQAAEIAATICWVVAIILCLVACCLRHSVAAASACIEVACDEMFEMPSLLLLPVVKSVFKGILSLLLIYGFLSLVSTAEITPYAADGLSRDFEFTKRQYYFMIYYMFMSFWLFAFVGAVYQFTVAFAVAEYYFTEYDHDQTKDVGCCAVWDGLHVGLWYHTGSLAFGSLLIAALQTLQKVIEYAEKKNQEVHNHALDCILACCLCCVNCCKEIVEFINRNAYIDMAITSDNFCDAARAAVAMIVQLGGAMAILNGATFVFSVFGLGLVTISAGAFTYYLSTCGSFADQSSSYFIDSPVTAMVAAMLIGFYVAMCFMDLLDMASDTLLYCYGVDIQDGKLGHTAPPALKDLVHSGEHGEAPSTRH